VKSALKFKGMLTNKGGRYKQLWNVSER